MIGTVASSTLNFRKTFIELLVEEGHEVYVFATDYSTQTSSAISTLGAHPISYKLNRGGLNPFADIKSALQLKKEIKAIEPDVVFSFFSKPVIFGTIAAKLAKVPRIVGMLEGLGYAFTPDSPQQKERFKKKLIRAVQIFLYKISFRYLDRLVFLNTDDPIDLIEKNNIKVKDIKILGGIGVDLEKFKPTPPSEDPICFLFVGRLLAEKGIFEFLKASEIVKNQHPELKFIVLGATDIDNPSSIKQKDLEHYIKKNIILYVGHVDNVYDWIINSSVFVLPSYREGLPCSTQEALSSGRAIITTDVVGCRDTIKHRVNGILVQPFNINQLVNAFLFFTRNKKEISKMGLESRKFAVKNFNRKLKDKTLKDLIIF